MISAVQSALSGLRTAGSRLDRAADELVRGQAATHAALSSAPGEVAPGATAAPPARPDPVAIAEGSGPDLADSVLAFKQAEVLYKASAKLLGALHRLEGELLDIDG